MSQFVRDVRSAFRSFRRAPGVGLVVILTAGLGIGATTTVFSVADGVMFKPLPYADAHQLVLVGSSSTRFPGLAPVNPMDFFDWRRENEVFSHLSAVDSYTFDLIGGTQPVRVEGAAVTEEFFDLLGVNAALGRTFRPGDDVATGERIVVLSHDFWQRRFGGDPSAVGRSLSTNDHDYTIIGVLPPGFRHPEAFWSSDVELWMPLSFIDNPLTSRGPRFLQVLGRLRDGVNIEEARTNMDGISRALAEQYPQNVDRPALLEPLRGETIGESGQALYMLLGAVSLLLLITCVNIANLLLAHATRRRREMALRRALGAGAGRIYRQLLTEGVVLALTGGLAGVALSAVAIRVFRAAHPVDLPRLAEIAVDVRVLGFAVLLSMGTGILFTLAPALRLAGTDTTEALKEGGSGGSARGTASLRNALVASEIALAVILVAGAALFARSLVQLGAADPGFDGEGVATLTVDLSDAYDSPERRVLHLETMAERFRAIPGVASVAYSSSLPLTGDRWITGFRIEGREVQEGSSEVADYSRVSPGFFATMGVRVVDGREFAATDDLSHENVLMVNEAFANRYWPGERAVGKRVGTRGRNSETWYTVVGVARDMSRFGLGQPAEPEFYFSALQRSTATAQFAVRVSGNREPVIAAMRTHTWDLDPTLPLTFGSFEQAIGQAMAQPRFQTALLIAFASLALFLAALGVYGTMAYTVEQRRREIGIRVALGASAGEIVRVVTRQTAAVTAVGLAVGLAGAVAASRTVGGMLYGVSPTDAGTYLIAALFLSGVAVIASLVPARRAGRHDPIAALRAE